MSSPLPAVHSSPRNGGALHCTPTQPLPRPASHSRRAPAACRGCSCTPPCTAPRAAPRGTSRGQRRPSQPRCTRPSSWHLQRRRASARCGGRKEAWCRGERVVGRAAGWCERGCGPVRQAALAALRRTQGTNAHLLPRVHAPPLDRVPRAHRLVRHILPKVLDRAWRGKHREVRLRKPRAAGSRCGAPQGDEASRRALTKGVGDGAADGADGVAQRVSDVVEDVCLRGRWRAGQQQRAEGERPSRAHLACLRAGEESRAWQRPAAAGASDQRAVRGDHGCQAASACTLRQARAPGGGPRGLVLRTRSGRASWLGPGSCCGSAQGLWHVAIGRAGRTPVQDGRRRRGGHVGRIGRARSLPSGLSVDLRKQLTTVVVLSNMLGTV